MAPFTPSIKVEAAFGDAPLDVAKTWVDLTSTYKAADFTISRGRPTEFDQFKPASCSLRLLDATRELDPTNLSGTYVETITTESFPVVDTITDTVDFGTDLGIDEATVLPDDIVVGDLLIAWVAVDLAGGATGVNLGTGSATWTELFDSAVSTNCRLACYARIATGSDDLVVSGASQDYVIEIHRVVSHGCSSTADIVVGTAATGSGAGTHPDPPALSPAASHKYLWLAGSAADTTTGESAFLASTSNMTSLVEQESANSTSSVALLVAWAQSEAATFNPTGFTTQPGGGAPWVANTIAVPPPSTSTDRTQIAPNVPIRVVATLPARATVLDDPCTGPGLHSAWRLLSGSLDALSGTLVVPAGGLVMEGPAYNFDGDSTFQFGVVADGTSPNFDVRVVTTSGNYFGWNLTGSTLTYLVHYGSTTADDSVTWDDTDHRYLRIRIDGEDLVWERSANGSAWTAIDTYTRDTDFPAIDIDWSFGKLYVASTGATCTLDDFKVEVSHFTRFTGAVDSWEYLPLGGNQGAVVNVQATDAFKLLANTQLPQRWKTTVEDLTPAAWYTLGERDGNSAFDASGNGLHGIIPACVKQGEEPVAPTLGNGSVRFSHDFPPNFYGIRLPDAARRTSYPWSVNLWVRPSQSFPRDATTYATSGNAMPAVLAVQGSSGSTVTQFELTVQAVAYEELGTVVVDWGVVLQWGSFSSAKRLVTYLANISSPTPHMVTAVVTDASTAHVYLDGAERTGRLDDPFEITAGYEDVAGLWIGHPAFILDDTFLSSTDYRGFDGLIDEFTIHDEALTASQIETLYQAGARLGGGDSTGARIDRVLDLIDWPPGLRQVDTGEVTLAPDYLFGDDALAYLQRVAQTEGGRLFIGPHGEVVFHDAGRLDTRGSDPVVFSDTGNAGELNILGNGFRVTHDDRLLFTAARVSRDGGATQTYQNDDAVDRYGTREWSGSVSMARLDSEALSRAIAIVERYKAPAPRLDQFTVAPEKGPDDWPLMLGLRLGDTMQATFTMLASGDTYDEYLDVAELNESVSDGAWTFELHGTPQDPAIGSFFQWNATADVGFDYGEWR